MKSKYWTIYDLEGSKLNLDEDLDVRATSRVSVSKEKVMEYLSDLGAREELINLFLSDWEKLVSGKEDTEVTNEFGSCFISVQIIDTII